MLTADHHTKPAKHHSEAAKHHESDNDEKAAHHAHTARASEAQLDGMVHVHFSRDSEEIRHGVGILARSFASRIGTRLRPEGVRDVGYSLARGLRILDAASYSKVANAVEEAMHVTLDGSFYIWPYIQVGC